MSYTTFKWGAVSASEPTVKPEFAVTVTVDITNTGSVAGSEVVQLYVELPKVEVSSPANQLRAFHKVKDLAPGKTETVTLALDKYAVSHWDDVIHKWVADKGLYKVRLGRSSDKFEGEVTFTLAKPFEWSGL